MAQKESFEITQASTWTLASKIISYFMWKLFLILFLSLSMDLQRWLGRHKTPAISFHFIFIVAFVAY